MAEERECGTAASGSACQAAATVEPAVSSAEAAEVIARSPKPEDCNSKCVFCRIAGRQEPGAELLYCEVGKDARPGGLVGDAIPAQPHRDALPPCDANLSELPGGTEASLVWPGVGRPLVGEAEAGWVPSP